MSLFLLVNWRVKKTTAYTNFYRTIHVVKDVHTNSNYSIGVFGSTFSYYAFDFKKYNGHNFSVEPQSIIYMDKTIKHYIPNIQRGGYAVISLTGCFFAAESKMSDEKCITYYSFLSEKEFDQYRWFVKIKYILKRYFPALSFYYVKCILKDEPFKYACKNSLSESDAVAQATKRLKGWEKVIGRDISSDFMISGDVLDRLNRNVSRMKSIIKQLRAHGIKPIFVVLPMSKAFHKVCPNIFYKEILYKCLELLKNEEVPIFDYLYDDQLSQQQLYLTADCLNAIGRELLSDRVINDINNIKQ